MISSFYHTEASMSVLERKYTFFEGKNNQMNEKLPYYPYSEYLKSKYQEAAQSIEEKKADRFREVVDEYYSFINDYPESENRKEADNIFKIAQRYVKE